MNITIETINILLLLLPGIMAGQIYYSIFKVSEVSVSKRLLDALSYSYAIYLMSNLVIQWEPLANVQNANNQIQFTLTNSRSVITLTLLLTATIPLLLGSIYHSDLFHKILRFLRITTKTSRGNTWNDAFATQDRRVIVTLKDENRVRGYPIMYSTDPEEGYLYLFDPVWVNDEKTDDGESDYIETSCHGFLINRDNIDLIEFTLNEGEELTSKKEQ